MKRVTFISDFTNPEVIETFTGAISNINNTLLSGIGFSASVLQQVYVDVITGPAQSFILKQTSLHSDWLSQRTQDSIGREAAILNEKCLLKIWESIHCPYIAFAIEEGQIAMLMNNLSDYLFPDVREPIDIKTEEIILNTLASLHTTFWESPEIKKIDWLAKPPQHLETFGPGKHPTDSFAPPPDKLFAAMNQGWEIAFSLLPPDMKSMFLQPAEKILERWQDLPVTLLHGDAKIANMALMPNGRIAVFDWAFVGQGPCGIELGWYIAVNATRLARSKEEVISTYRRLLEFHLQYSIEEKTWIRMIDLAVFTGAKMLLWSKGLAYKTGTERAKNEWDWWIQKLKIVVVHSR